MTDSTETPGENPTAKAAAALLGVDPSRVRQWVRDGRLEAVDGSEPLRVSLESVLRLREQRQQAGTEPAAKPVSRRALAELQATAERVERLEAELLAERAKRETLEAETRRELRALEREAGRSEVLEKVVEELRQERDTLAARLEQAQKRRGLFRRG